MVLLCFCTPGFVMSLFAMAKILKNLITILLKKQYQEIYGCTGYRPIIDAAKSLNNKKDSDHFKEKKK